MTDPNNLQTLEAHVETLYNAHPFPQRATIPAGKSDERYKYIFENFLGIPDLEMLLCAEKYLFNLLKN